MIVRGSLSVISQSLYIFRIKLGGKVKVLWRDVINSRMQSEEAKQHGSVWTEEHRLYYVGKLINHIHQQIFTYIKS